MTSELIETIKQSLGITIPERPELLSPLDLAYVGDNVYEMCNRLLALRAGSRQVEKLHKECSHRASAKT